MRLGGIGLSWGDVGVIANSDATHTASGMPAEDRTLRTNICRSDPPTLYSVGRLPKIALWREPNQRQDSVDVRGMTLRQ